MIFGHGFGFQGVWGCECQKICVQKAEAAVKTALNLVAASKLHLVEQLKATTFSLVHAKVEDLEALPAAASIIFSFFAGIDRRCLKPLGKLISSNQKIKMLCFVKNGHQTKKECMQELRENGFPPFVCVTKVPVKAKGSGNFCAYILVKQA